MGFPQRQRDFERIDKEIANLIPRSTSPQAKTVVAATNLPVCGSDTRLPPSANLNFSPKTQGAAAMARHWSSRTKMLNAAREAHAASNIHAMSGNLNLAAANVSLLLEENPISRTPEVAARSAG